jgi:hypothetical protein
VDLTARARTQSTTGADGEWLADAGHDADRSLPAGGAVAWRDVRRHHRPPCRMPGHPSPRPGREGRPMRNRDWT